MSFVHLHTHTQYSLLDGANKIKEYISRVKALGMNSAAITDHGVMYGIIDFYKEALSQGIKPIIGCEIYLAKDGNHKEKTTGNYHLVLLAETNEGYENLTKLVSIAFVEGYYYKPRADKDLLRKYSKGLIATSACLQGEIAQKLINNDYEGAKQAALEYAEIFGKNSFFLEMQNHGIELQSRVNQELMRLSKETNIELIVTNDVHYTYKEDYLAHDILLCIQTNKHLNDENRMRYEAGEFYVRSEEEMRALFPYAPYAVENTQKIADRCNVEIKFHQMKLPKYDVPAGNNAYSYLKQLCMEGLKKRYETITDSILERLEFELKTINDMGFVDYFLIVWDFIKFAKEHDIMVGPGRGSATGSIVSYCLSITDVDPLPYNLLFERFLNPHRVSMPDIDIDFCYERRAEVIDYVVKKYGSDRVVQIITFGTMAARAVIRDVGRVMNLPYGMVDSIAKMIPAELNITIDKALTMNPKLGEAVLNDKNVATLIEMSRKLEGMPRHSSIHAAGVVICGKPADELVPLSRAADATITTQFTMTTIEELGLLKMDFLGLRTLTVIQKAVQMAQIRLEDTDEQCEAVYKMIAAGNTDGVFQLESAGMKSFMQNLQPTCFEDIVAGISLYRPGPMDFIPQYIKGKKNPDTVTYHCEELRDILSTTYGCIVYQEQVMQIVQKLAGYSLGKSDILRRAMSKKKADVMNRERQNFVYGNEEEGIAGCINNGISEKTANTIFDEMIDFAKYAFNKSHSVAYSVVAYRTAYLKCYHKVEFMAALLCSVIDNLSKTIAYLYSCKQMGIKVLPPDINRGGMGFKVVSDYIVYALDSIKAVGSSSAKQIEEERITNGDYLSLYDFLERTRDKGINKKTVENLIRAGAMDNLEVNRKTMLMGYQDMLDSIQKNSKEQMKGQRSIFDLLDGDFEENQKFKLNFYEELPREVLLSDEKEVLGIYLSGHPLDEYEDVLRINVTAKNIDFAVSAQEETRTVYDRQIVTVGGIITKVKKIFTKTNKQMAYLELEDLTGSIEVIVFPNTLEKYDSLLYEDTKLLLKGDVSVDDETKPAKLLMKSAVALDEIPKRLFLEFKDIDDYKKYLGNINKLSQQSHGKDELIAFLHHPRSMKVIKFAIDASDDGELCMELKKLIGDKRVKSVYKKLDKF